MFSESDPRSRKCTAKHGSQGGNTGTGIKRASNREASRRALLGQAPLAPNAGLRDLKGLGHPGHSCGTLFLCTALLSALLRYCDGHQRLVNLTQLVMGRNRPKHFYRGDGEGHWYVPQDSRSSGEGSSYSSLLVVEQSSQRDANIYIFCRDLSSRVPWWLPG